MKNTILIIILVFSTLQIFGQESQTNEQLKNTVFVEAFGNGLFGSINYERQLTKEPGLSLRAGIGFYTEDEFYFTLPFSVQYLINFKKNHFMETGIGYTWANPNNSFNDNYPNNIDKLNNLFLSIGYRNHFGKDWMWKVCFTPLIINNKDVTLPWGGISIGKRF